MKFIDLAAQQKRIREEIENSIQKVLNHSQYIMGPEINELEKKLAEFIVVKHAISCSSGTDALLLSLMAFNIGPGDAVFTTPFTFIATAEVISFLGATPVFVDIDSRTFNMDPGKLEQAILALKANDPKPHPLPITQLKTSITPRGIIAVDLFGLPADYDRINTIAQKHEMFVIGDAAQSFGSEYKGKKSCSLADVACTSFFPAKPLGCYGDAGMCFTDNKSIAEIMESIRIHGKGNHQYDNVRIGINGRMDTLQAAILLAKFEIFPEEIERRGKIAKAYSDLLSYDNSDIVIPYVPEGYKSAWAQYSLLAKDENHRLEIQTRLKGENIPTAIYYPKPLHLQTAFDSLSYKKGDFPISEDISNRIFSLPMHPYLNEKDQKQITNTIKTSQVLKYLKYPQKVIQ